MIRSVNDMMSERLASRVIEGTYRNLQQNKDLYDFSSNDYLGFSRNPELQERILAKQQQYPFSKMGSTGSRLLTGNSEFAEELEKELGLIHNCQNALIFNSGYQANEAIFSTLPGKHDTVISDECIHASVIDGCRTGLSHRWKFKHNDLEDLEKKLRNSYGITYVVVESVYSMEGDMADMFNIMELCEDYGAHLIVDEAHALGVFGTGLIDTIGGHNRIFARIVTFGKALGLHGAAVLCSDLTRNYLINYARAFIYTTAPPVSHLIAVQEAYYHMLLRINLQKELTRKTTLFKDNMPPQHQLVSTINPTPIQLVYIKGNQNVMDMSEKLQHLGFDVRAIRSPTVPKGKERLRVCIHVHNDDHEILRLCHHFDQLSKK